MLAVAEQEIRHLGTIAKDKTIGHLGGVSGPDPGYLHRSPGHADGA